MSDQNQFDQIKQKLLHFWAVFLAACGRLWVNVKKYAKQAAEFTGRNAKVLGQKLAVLWSKLKAKASELMGRIGEWLGAILERIRQAWAARTAKSKAEPEVRKLPETDQADENAADETAEAEATETAAEPEAETREAAGVDAETAEAAEVPAAAESAEDGEMTAGTDTRSAKTENNGGRFPAWFVKTCAVLVIIGKAAKFVLMWLWKLRRILMAIPVLWIAIKYAVENMNRLPESVGLDIQSSGEFARMISREQAVFWPLGITIFCLVLMFCAKKPMLPWVISIFSLVLPVLIWLTNFYA